MSKTYLKIAPNEWKNASRDKRELSVAKELGYDVIVMAKGDVNDKGRIDMVDGYYVYRFSTRPLKSLPNKVMFLNRILALLQWSLYAKKFGADIISGHDLYALLMGYLSNIFTSSKAKLIYDSHEMELYRNKKRNFIQKRGIKLLEGYLLKRADINMMVNDSIADEVQKIYNLKVRPLVVRNIPSNWKINKECILQQRQKYFAEFRDQNNFIIMYHGLIGKGNGIELVIRALSQVAEVNLVIMGFCYDLKYLSQLKGEIQELGLQKRVLFKEAVSLEELYKYVGAADVGMMTFEAITKSYYYSLPNKLFENIQSLTPVICSDFPEMRRIIKKYNIGLTCDPQDISEIARCILLLKEDKKLYEKLEENLKLAKKELCWEEEKKILQEALKKLEE